MATSYPNPNYLNGTERVMTGFPAKIWIALLRSTRQMHDAAIAKPNGHVVIGQRAVITTLSTLLANECGMAPFYWAAEADAACVLYRHGFNKPPVPATAKVA